MKRFLTSTLGSLVQAVLIAALCAMLVASALGQTPNVGSRDFSFGTTGTAAPTGEKPESKLWLNDGAWWGTLYNNSIQAYSIYRFDPAAAQWIDTGTQIDDRNLTNGDALWDEANGKLYVASHIFRSSSGTVTTTVSNWARLYRFTYDSGTMTYALDPGFPVTVNNGSAEALVLAKDSTGVLWVTYTQGNTVMVNSTIGSPAADDTWGTPFVLPVSPTAVALKSDDISSVIAFGGNVGIFWSNQNTRKCYFSVHRDGDPRDSWSNAETALPVPGGIELADDHINLKSDSSGRVFAAIKTSNTSSSQPLIELLVRDARGNWSSYVVGQVRDNLTRPIVALDTTNNLVYVVSAGPDSGSLKSIYYKYSSLGNIVFPRGKGAPLMQSSVDLNLNNPTSTKQNLDSSTGLLALGTDSTTRYYYHNRLTLASSTAPTIASFTPKSAPQNSLITITGTGFNSANVVAFYGISTNFNVVSDTQITATVPTGAKSGPITISTVAGPFATSPTDFKVTSAPSITSFTPTSGTVGTTVTIAGKGFTGTTSVTFNGVTASFVINSDTKITTTVPTGATTGPITVTNPAGSATSAVAFTVL